MGVAAQYLSVIFLFPFSLIKRGAKIKVLFYHFFLNKKVIKKSRLRVLPDNEGFIVTGNHPRPFRLTRMGCMV